MKIIMNKKIITTIIVVVVLILAAVTGIFINQDSELDEKEFKMYFLTENGSSITAEAKKITYDSEDEILEAVLDSMLKGPGERKNLPIAGNGTRVLDLSQEGSELTVDFSKEFLRDDDTKNMLSVYAVVKTLCQIDKISSVMVTVDGKGVKAADNKVIGFLSHKDINLETDTYTTDSKVITLYFADKDGKNLIRETRTIKITDTKPIESYIISELIKGPVNSDLVATLSPDTELISAETANDTCHVTFKNFIDINLSEPESDKSKLAVYSVVNSLAELDEVKYVRFLFKGKTEETVGPFNFSEDFKKDKDIVRKREI